MSIHRAFALVVVLGGLLHAVPAQAQFLESFVRDFKRNNCWPEPFLPPDRQAVRTPFVIMVNNGWRRQNILGDYHFKPEGGELTEAGKLKIRWILTEAPQQHRTIFVYRAHTPEETSSRVDAVQQMAALYVPKGDLPAVVETSIPAGGWPADQVDKLSREYFEKSQPAPRLPEKQQGTASK